MKNARRAYKKEVSRIGKCAHGHGLKKFRGERDGWETPYFLPLPKTNKKTLLGK